MMTKLLDQALDTVRRLPAAEQDEIARAMLSLARTGESEPELISIPHIFHVLEGLAQARKREFVGMRRSPPLSRRFDP